MDITVEISMYPLRENYEPAIVEFITNIKGIENLEVRVNPSATHIFGPYDLVMDALKAEIAKSFHKYGKAVFAVKFLNGNLSESLDGKNL